MFMDVPTSSDAFRIEMSDLKKNFMLHSMANNDHRQYWD